MSIPDQDGAGDAAETREDGAGDAAETGQDGAGDAPENGEDAARCLCGSRNCRGTFVFPLGGQSLIAERPEGKL